MKRLFICLIALLSVTMLMAQQVFHTIQRGETLESIAKKYHISVNDLKQANPNTADMCYAGQKLIIPSPSNNVSVDNSQIDTKNNAPVQYDIQANEEHKPISNQAQDRKMKVVEFGYAASTFDDVKVSGSYGYSVTFLPWEITENLYMGVHISPFYLNFGLVDKDLISDVIKLGPALGYYFTPTIFVTLPVTAVCAVYFKNSDTKSSWGMSWAPSLYVGNKKFGLFAGPMFTLPFEGESKVSTGFRAGIYF